MSLERLSPTMRNCILMLQAESVVGYYKAENKNNNERLLSRILKSFR